MKVERHTNLCGYQTIYFTPADKRLVFHGPQLLKHNFTEIRYNKKHGIDIGLELIFSVF